MLTHYGIKVLVIQTLRTKGPLSNYLLIHGVTMAGRMMVKTDKIEAAILELEQEGMIRRAPLGEWVLVQAPA